MTEPTTPPPAAEPTAPPATAAPAQAPASAPPPGPATRLARVLGSLVVPILAIVSGLFIGALVIVFSDREIVGLLGRDPLAGLGAAVDSVSRAYGALLTGSIGDPGRIADALASGDARSFERAFRPISESLVRATPLIFAGLAVALGFRSGLFNIGAEGQLYLGAIFAVFVGFTLTGLPWFIHLPLTVLAGFLGGAVWGFIPGILKARTGAHEVIVTIMLNYVAYRLLDLLLKNQPFQRAGSANPISKIIEESAEMPQLIAGLRVTWWFPLALLTAAGVSWLLFHSTRGFEFRAVGLNPGAARYAGIRIGRTLVLTMMISGALAGLAGASVMIADEGTLTPGFSPGYGFDAIAIALLGRSRPLGVVAAAILFGILRAGATPMQAATQIPIDLVVVVQSFIVMFIAAPALVRTIYRIRTPRVSGTEVFSKGWGT
ncbi:MAG TPA: ABC transporter permease [Candidatus Limnocylindrales bacterium]